MGWTKRWKRRLRTLARREAVERELDEELAFHLEMETEKNLRAGMSPEEACRRAVLAFGGVERHKEEVREARLLGWVPGLSLDFRLGARMLRKYPGLTLVGGLAMAVAIAAGAATFELVTQLLHPSLPLVEGDRIVGVRVRDAEAGRIDFRMASELGVWREEVETVRELGAFRTVGRNLIVPGGSVEPVVVSEMSASGFGVARVPPRLGRFLVEADAIPGAPQVVVLGHDLWRTRFGADPGVVGRTVRLGGEEATVVGVMPEGFGFPYVQQMWMPLRLRAGEHAPGEGPVIHVFGRLAPGVSLREAHAELAALGGRAAADSPHTHAHLRPEVVPYARSVEDVPWRIITGAAYSTNAGVLMFLLLVCANVATLVFARTASRESELVVRTALGASRRRIVMQLFAEALVLGALAAALGLGIATLGLRWGMGVLESVMMRLPFWFHAGLSPATEAYAALLAVLAAALAGVVPALKMTGREGEGRLRQAAAGGSSLRFGRVWTVLIVGQVALMAASVPIVVDAALDTEEIRSAEPGFPAAEFLSARLVSDPDASSGADPRAAYAELERRLEADPRVAGASFVGQVPGAYHVRHHVEVEGAGMPRPSESDPRMMTGAAAPDFFDLLGAPIVAGRGLSPLDARPEARVVVVNESFVREALGGRNAVGRRLRYRDVETPASERDPEGGPSPWYEIVGVVRDVAMTIDPDLDHGGGIYHPLDPASPELHLAVRVRGDPEAFAPRLRELAFAVDPTLRLLEIRTMDAGASATLETYRFWSRVALLGCGVVLLLSVLGMYSIMAFTVTRRTREIGVRIALGADPRRIVRAVFSRALGQMALGAAFGTLLLLVLAGGIHSVRMAWILAGSVGLLGVAVLAACLVPVRRALSVQPTEAMRTDA